MYDGWFSLGGNEVINNERIRGYGQTADCPMTWLKGPQCDTLAQVLGTTFNYSQITSAPWYDPALPSISSRFFGAYALGARGIPDSTRTASVTEGITDGGTIGRQRDAVREVRIRAILIARGSDALDYGMSWLDSVLDPGACGQHGGECGLSDLEFFAECPPARGEVTEPAEDPDDPPVVRPQTDAEWAATVDTYRRYLHDVATISGPLVTAEFAAGDFTAYQVEFVIAAERPWVFSKMVDLNLEPSFPIVVQDIPYNLAEYPSAELAGASVLVAKNFSTNPSVETDATGWATVADGAVILGANVVGARSTEIAAVGLASYRARFTAPAASAATGWFGFQQTVDITTAEANAALSISLWATANVESGTAVINRIDYVAYWQNAASATLRTDPLGTAPMAGGARSQRSITPPAGATKVIVRAQCFLSSWAAGAVVRLYGDALAVTVP